MKKRIGELNKKPIVIGDSNLVTDDEILYKEEDGNVILSIRDDSGELKAITSNTIPQEPCEPEIIEVYKSYPANVKKLAAAYSTMILHHFNTDIHIKEEYYIKMYGLQDFLCEVISKNKSILALTLELNNNIYEINKVSINRKDILIKQISDSYSYNNIVSDIYEKRHLSSPGIYYSNSNYNFGNIKEDIEVYGYMNTIRYLYTVFIVFSKPMYSIKFNKMAVLSINNIILYPFNLTTINEYNITSLINKDEKFDDLGHVILPYMENTMGEVAPVSTEEAVNECYNHIIHTVNNNLTRDQIGLFAYFDFTEDREVRCIALPSRGTIAGYFTISCSGNDDNDYPMDANIFVDGLGIQTLQCPISLIHSNGYVTEISYYDYELPE